MPSNYVSCGRLLDAEIGILLDGSRVFWQIEAKPWIELWLRSARPTWVIQTVDPAQDSGRPWLRVEFGAEVSHAMLDWWDALTFTRHEAMAYQQDLIIGRQLPIPDQEATR